MMFKTNNNALSSAAGKNTRAARSYEVFDPNAVEMSADVCQTCACVFCYAQ